MFLFHVSRLSRACYHLSRTVEFRVLSVEGKLGQEIVNVFGDERCISSHAFAGYRAPRQALEPAGV